MRTQPVIEAYMVNWGMLVATETTRLVFPTIKHYDALLLKVIRDQETLAARTGLSSSIFPPGKVVPEQWPELIDSYLQVDPDWRHFQFLPSQVEPPEDFTLVNITELWILNRKYGNSAWVRPKASRLYEWIMEIGKNLPTTADWVTHLRIALLYQISRSIICAPVPLSTVIR